MLISMSSTHHEKGTNNISPKIKMRSLSDANLAYKMYTCLMLNMTFHLKLLFLYYISNTILVNKWTFYHYSLNLLQQKNVFTPVNSPVKAMNECGAKVLFIGAN